MHRLGRRARRTRACRSRRAWPRACGPRGPTCRCRTTTTRPRQLRMSSTARHERVAEPRRQRGDGRRPRWRAPAARSASAPRGVHARRVAAVRATSSEALLVHRAKYTRRPIVGARPACRRPVARRRRVTYDRHHDAARTPAGPRRCSPPPWSWWSCAGSCACRRSSGYLLVGIVLGPHALALGAARRHDARTSASSASCSSCSRSASSSACRSCARCGARSSGSASRRWRSRPSAR